MDLSLYERVVLVNILPKESKNYTRARVVKNLLEKIEPSEEDIKKYTLNGGIKEKDSPLTNIELSISDLDLIEETLRELENSGKFSIQLVGLYEKFVSFAKSVNPPREVEEGHEQPAREGEAG